MLIFKQDDVLAVTVQTQDDSWNPVNFMKTRVYEMMQTTDGANKALLIICLIIMTAIILKSLFSYLALYFLTPIRNRILNDMRIKMYNKVLQMPVGFFTEKRKGDVLSTMSNDINEVESSTISVLESTLKEPIVILFSLVYMIILSPQLTVFLLIFLPVMGFVLGRLGRTLKRKSKRVLEQYGSIFSMIEETLGGIRVIKAFSAEKFLQEKFLDENDKFLHYKNKANRRRDLASPVSEVMGVMAVLCILYYGGRLVLSDGNTFGLNAGDFLAYIAIFSQLIQPLKALSNASFNVQRGAAGIERIEKFIEEPVTLLESSNPEALKNFTQGIELRNVSFKYNDKWVLKNINLQIPKGKTVALVGSSGSGKSTLADLLPRFIDATEGQVLIDGKDIKSYSLNSIRSHMGIVTQEAILFNTSIEQNIALGNPGASRTEILKAASIANASEFIERKENGLESNVGERGMRLSGGERQRITIARAVLKNPPILILDEATSSLDTESERLVQEAINNLMTNRTSLVIAHRLSTIRNADEIVVLQHGEIVERGTHDQLLTLGGVYSRLISMQEVR
jgi:subfamily B ATP-binding cassette protein MsbA